MIASQMDKNIMNNQMNQMNNQMEQVTNIFRFQEFSLNENK